MSLIAISEPAWIFIVGTICATVVNVVTIIVTKKGLSKSIEENTQVTTAAARHAQVAGKVGVANLRATRAAAQKAEAGAEKIECVEQQVRELQQDSALIKREGHFKAGNGDNGGAEQ